MAISRWRPRRTDMSPFENWYENWPMPFSNMMDEFFGSAGRGENMMWGPNVDIMETPDMFEIHAELPGVRQEDVQINLNNNVLTISGEKRQEIKEDGEGRNNPLRVERSYGRFERSFALPTSVNPDAVRATYDEGVLTILLPKAEEARSRPIPIESGAQQRRGQTPGVQSGPVKGEPEHGRR